jgi:hypothetical protein
MLWLLLVLSVVTVTLTVASGVDCSQFFFIPEQGSNYSYYINSTPVAFNSSLCKEISPQARLAVLRNQVSRNYMYNQVMKFGSSAWFGLWKTKVDLNNPLANWVWSDGVNCTADVSDQRCYPMITAFSGGGQQCACITNFYRTSDYFDDIECTTQMPRVCEIDSKCLICIDPLLIDLQFHIVPIALQVHLRNLQRPTARFAQKELIRTLPVRPFVFSAQIISLLQLEVLLPLRVRSADWVGGIVLNNVFNVLPGSSQTLRFQHNVIHVQKESFQNLQEARSVRIVRLENGMIIKTVSILAHVRRAYLDVMVKAILGRHLLHTVPHARQESTMVYLVQPTSLHAGYVPPKMVLLALKGRAFLKLNRVIGLMGKEFTCAFQVKPALVAFLFPIQPQIVV